MVLKKRKRFQFFAAKKCTKITQISFNFLSFIGSFAYFKINMEYVEQKKSVFKDYSYKLLAINFVFWASELKLRLPLISLNLCFCVCEFVTFNLHTIYEVVNFPRNFIISRCNWFMCTENVWLLLFCLPCKWQIFHFQNKLSPFWKL